MSIATPYITTSTVAHDPNSIFWLEKGTQGRTTVEDIQDALKEYERNYHAGNSSKAEILTLHRAFPDSPTYKQAAIGIQKMDMVDPMVIGGPASIEMIDREGHLITTNALNRAFQKFMGNQRTRNVMVLHSDVQVGWALPAYISKGGQIFKSGVGENGLFFICELRDDTAIAKKVIDQINNGLLKSYSIAGSATKVQNMKKGLTPYMQVDEMELAEVTVCEKGVNQGANFEILKAELPQTGKVDKDQCGYRDATAPEMKLGINCGHCKYFNSDTRTCDVVVGDIMPGDYCRLFEAGEEDKPQIQVHRKIVIMRSDNTGKINFNKSFVQWMKKEEDPLKSGKSFHTLNNIAGREAEHHRLLQEYGFPSEVPLDSMRYIPVVETETDDDGKPIHLIPPWVVNEAGEFLGDKLDEDAPSFKKSLGLFNDLLQKKQRKSRRPYNKGVPGAYKRALPKDNERLPGSARTSQMPGKKPTSVQPRQSWQRDEWGKPTDKVRYKRDKQIPDIDEQDEFSLDKAPIGVSQTDPSDPSKRQAPAPQPPENQYQTGQNQPLPNIPAPNTGASTSPPPAKKFYPDELTPQQPMTQREQRGQEFGEMRRGAEKPLGQMQRLFRQGGRGATKWAKENVGHMGDLAEAARGGAKGAWDAGKEFAGGTTEGARFGYDPGDPDKPEQRGPRTGTPTYDRIRRYRDYKLQEPGSRKRSGYMEPSAARTAGRLFGIGGRAATSMGGRALASGGRQALRTGRGAYRAGMGTARGLAGAKGEDQPGSSLVRQDQRREADKERIGGVGGTGKAGYRAGRALREFGRGAMRGGTPSERLRGKRDESRFEGGARAGGRESTAERVGRVFGKVGRVTGRQAANVAAEMPKQMQRRREASTQRRANVAQARTREGQRKERLDAHLKQERIGEGAGAFRPSAHEGMSASERHDDVSTHLESIGNGYNLTPKNWMSVIHHLTQSEDGQRFAHFNDVDIPGENWHEDIKATDSGSRWGGNRIGAADMRKHIQRMMDNGQISFGEHGGEGQRALDSIMGKLENAHTNKEQLKIKRLGEKRTSGLDEDEPSKPAERERSTSEQEQQERLDELDKKKGREQRYRDAEIDMSWDAEKAPVHKVFAKAFGLASTRR